VLLLQVLLLVVLLLQVLLLLLPHKSPMWTAVGFLREHLKYYLTSDFSRTAKSWIFVVQIPGLEAV
jgi:hypothetical protein